MLYHKDQIWKLPSQDVKFPNELPRQTNKQCYLPSHWRQITAAEQHQQQTLARYDIVYFFDMIVHRLKNILLKR